MKTSSASILLILLASCFSSHEQSDFIKNSTELYPVKSDSGLSEDKVHQQRKVIGKKKKHPLDFSKCGLSEKARRLAKLIVNSSEQKRIEINCNLKLSQIAEKQAIALAESGVIDHNLGGTPNQRLIAHGFNLPEQDRPHSNTVEAILGGEEFAENVWLKFQSSYAHKRHLLGEHEFFSKQTEIGVGHFYKWHSPHIDYWVIYISGKATKNNPLDISQ